MVTQKSNTSPVQGILMASFKVIKEFPPDHCFKIPFYNPTDQGCHHSIYLSKFPFILCLALGHQSLISVLFAVIAVDGNQWIAHWASDTAMSRARPWPRVLIQNGQWPIKFHIQHWACTNQPIPTQ